MSKAKWKWCLHCFRCYLDGEFKIDEDPMVQGFYRMAYAKDKQSYEQPMVCPYPGCDGTLLGDSWDWDNVRATRPQWPEVPERGVVYDVYKKNGE